MLTSTESRIAAGAGIAGVIILLIAQGLVIDAPTIGKPAAEIRQWAIDHRGQQLTAVYLLGFGFALQLLFWSGLWRILRGPEGGGLLAVAGLAGVVSLTSVILAGITFSGALAFRASALSDDNARLLNDLVFVSINMSSIATALALGAFGLLIVQNSPLPAWLGWSGLVAAAIHLIAGAAYAHDGFFSPQGIGIYLAPVLYYLWVAIASVLILRRPSG